MNIKCIAIGNRIMKDDGIGISIAEAIKEKLHKEDILVVICETDFDYALNELNNVDLLFIIDSSFSNIEPGSITMTSIDDQIESREQIYSQHQINLIDLIMKYKIPIKGYIIGIEIAEISYGLQLSDCLSEHFTQICDEVYNLIIKTGEEIKNA
jgi:hydrogenase maturation protease